jgi:hypothetical protein
VKFADGPERGVLFIAFAMNRGKSKLQPKEHNGVQVEPSEQDADHFLPNSGRPASSLSRSFAKNA